MASEGPQRAPRGLFAACPPGRLLPFTRAPESMDENAFEATRTLRKLLRPDLLTRLIDPGAIGWLVIGLVAAAGAARETTRITSAVMVMRFVSL